MIRTAAGDMHYTSVGDGPPLLLMLPQSGGPVGIGPFVAALAARFRAICYDQRGTGASPPPADPAAVSMADRADEAAALLEALGIGRAHLFGHSTGCGIALAFAEARPDRVARMVLAAPWAYADAHLSTMQHLRIAAARGLGAADYARFNASLLFPPAYRRAHADGFAHQAAAAAPPDAGQIAARLQAILAFDTRPLLARIGAPTLVISADDDQLMPAWFGREIAAGLPHGRYGELNGAGHMLPETATDRVARLVADFLTVDDAASL